LFEVTPGDAAINPPFGMRPPDDGALSRFPLRARIPPTPGRQVDDLAASMAIGS